MADQKTHPTEVRAEDFIAAVEPEAKREEARALDAMFRRVTGWEPVMWGPSIIGYGRYTYRYDSGRTGTYCATGFSPRKAEHSLYILPTWGDYGADLERLGRHRKSKGCLYVKRLSDIDMGVLEELVRRGLADLDAKWPVSA